MGGVKGAGEQGRACDFTIQYNTIQYNEKFALKN